MPLINLKKVGLNKNGVTLLRDIDWKIEKGRDWILFGKNGSGKSLLLQIIEGYIHPSVGEVVRFEQSDGLDLREMRKRTGFIGTFIKKSIRPSAEVFATVVSGKFASVGLYDDFSDEDSANALRLMKITGCLALKGRKYGTLSDGEKERVLIARSLMSEPELLILDEPCSGLDIAGREDFLSTLREVKKHHPDMSILFVTHHTDEITDVFTHMMILKDGTVFRSGEINDLLTSENISRALDISVKIRRENNRYWCVVNNVLKNDRNLSE